MYPTNNRTIEQKALAKVICTLRKTKNLKREYLADILSLSVGSVDKIEQGKTHIRFTDVVRLCEVMHLDVNQVSDAYKEELVKLTTPPRGKGKMKIALGC